MPQREPLGVVGPSSKARSAAQQSGRTVNLYPEVNDRDAKAPIALHHTPGSFRAIDLAALAGALPPIRGLHVMADRMFVVCAEKLYEIYPDTSARYLAALPTFAGRVGMSDNAGMIIVGDGTGFYIYNFNTGTFNPVLNNGVAPILGYVSRLINGQTLYFERDSSRYFFSDIDNPVTVSGLSFFSAEGNSDKTIAAFVTGLQIVIMGSASTEWHWNSGDATTPFERIGGAFTEHGCVGRNACCVFDNTVIMVGHNSEGNGIVWRIGGAGSAPVRVSTHAVEKAIEKVLFAFNDVTEDVTMWAYQDAGHSFAVLNLPAVPATINNLAQPSQTWVYDSTTGMWHERGWLNPATGQLERIIGDFHVLWRGQHWTGAKSAAHVYRQSLDYYRDNNDPLLKMRETSGPLTAAGRRFKVQAVIIELETGVGRDGGVQGSDPKMMMQYRWGTGAWSEEVWRPIGKIGEGRTTVRFGPCGVGTDFTVRLAISDPVRVTLTGGWADIEIGV